MRVGSPFSIPGSFDSVYVTIFLLKRPGFKGPEFAEGFLEFKDS